MDLFNFVFSTFWHWLGTFILLSLLVKLASNIFKAFGTKPTYITTSQVTVEASEANVRVKGNVSKTPEQ